MVFYGFSLGQVVLYNVFMVFPLPKALVKTLAQNLIKNLAKNMVKHLGLRGLKGVRGICLRNVLRMFVRKLPGKHAKNLFF